VKVAMRDSTFEFQEQVSLLARLVGIDSGSEDIAGVTQVGEIMSAELLSLGFEVRSLGGGSYGPAVYATRSPGRTDVMLMGHMDTVFPAGTAACRPFTIDEDSQIARGPGVLDMKGGLALLVHALRIACDGMTDDSAIGIRVLLNGDEEPGSPESRVHLPACLDGVQCVFLLEPPDAQGQLVLARRGIGVFRLTAAGRSAHAAEGTGANAIHALIHALSYIVPLEDSTRGTSVNVGTLHGGKGPSIVPEAAEALVDVRVASRAERDRIQHAMAGLSELRLPAGTSVSVEGTFHRPPMEPVAGTARLRHLLASAAKDLGMEVLFETTPRGGASDGNLITALGVPCIDGMGPIGGGAHTEKEWADLTSLRERTQLLAEVIRRMLQGDGIAESFPGEAKGSEP
jgi:glutamate carboxypeptidase